MNPPCPLANVRVVLSHTSHPGNIGAAARAMKTMGLSTLYLVNPKSFPDKEAETRAAGAWDVLNSAKVCSSLVEALGDTVLARCTGVVYPCKAASGSVGFWNRGIRSDHG